LTSPDSSAPAACDAPRPGAPSFGEAFRFWLKLGFISFGGPTGQIAIMHTELVERRRWISEARFVHALNYCMLLPGPEAQQLATYVGWLLHKTRGGLAAGVLFVLPSAMLLWILAYVYCAHGDVPWIAAVFLGMKPVVMAVVAFAVLRIGKKVLKNPAMWTIAAAAFVAIYWGGVPFPAIVAAAAAIGLLGDHVAPRTFRVLAAHGGGATGRAAIDDHDPPPAHARRSWARALVTLAVCGGLWAAPIAVSTRVLGADHVVTQEGVFFSQAAVVTFGGAYAVLPYIATHAVRDARWIESGQMMDGLALAETTPGPLIMVVQFVGFVAGWRHPGELSPIAAATLGAAITTWCTFVPCFLYIFLGAPFIEQLRNRPRLTAMLSAITAAVVGVVLNLAVWFAAHVVAPRPGTVDIGAIAVGLAAFVALHRYKVEMIPVIACGAAYGLVRLLIAG